MFQAGARNARTTSSDSESDWDTTVDIPTPRQQAADNNTAPENAVEDVYSHPVPKSRSSALTAREDGTVQPDRQRYNANQEDGLPASWRKETKTPASASGVRLSAREPVSRNGSPLPPDTVPPLPKWDDSDAEQQTLRELHMNLKKEKTREYKNEAARRQINDEGDHSTTSARPTAVWKQSREDGHRQQTTVEGSASKGPGRKHGVSSPLPETETARSDSLYPSLLVKDADGKRYLYYFSEGSTAFYPADNEDSEAMMPRIADKVEIYVRRGWQEVFGVIRIMTSVIVILLVESLNFVTNHIARPLILGVLSMVGDRLIKPLLAALFNLVLQPAVVFSWNLAAGLERVCRPLINILGAITFTLAQLLQSFRLVEVTLRHEHPLNHRQQNMHVV